MFRIILGQIFELCELYIIMLSITIINPWTQANATFRDLYCQRPETTFTLLLESWLQSSRVQMTNIPFVY